MPPWICAVSAFNSIPERGSLTLDTLVVNVDVLGQEAAEIFIEITTTVTEKI
jgi:hypothetical protein